MFMRLPNRKPGKYTFAQFDPVMTEEKLQALKDKLERIQKHALPKAIKETRKYAENGDFSENAEYQIAKGRLRGLNQTVLELQQQISHAKIIQPDQNTETVQIGHRVTISTNNAEYTFQILGSTETNPSAGILSYQSPLGSALIGRKVGDNVKISAGDNEVEYTIIQIE